jgi:hypothetical protein
MTNPIIKEHNVSTGEIIEREMNKSELAQLAASQTEAVAMAEAKVTKEAAKAALLEKLGISEDEAKLLLS